jgi:ADP-ribosyl-[dinitrogen reductase] hydrolase
MRPDDARRYRGALVGLAVGDALGTTLEFRPPGTFQPIDDMVGGGPFHLNPGEWTDDTSMALCLAESLLERNGFDPADQMRRYLRWWLNGHLSSNGYCFDIGNTVRQALEQFRAHGDPRRSGQSHQLSAGNGSLMRLAPIPLFFARDPDVAVARAADSSATTHAHAEAVDACRVFASLIVGAVQGKSKDALLTPDFAGRSEPWARGDLVPAVARVVAGSFLERHPPDIRGTGYVVNSLEAALWAFANSETFESGALMAVNLGDDADTTGAVYGQLAGAFYGERGIPRRWRERIARRELIERIADRLHAARI